MRRGSSRCKAQEGLIVLRFGAAVEYFVLFVLGVHFREHTQTIDGESAAVTQFTVVQRTPVCASANPQAVILLQMSLFKMHVSHAQQRQG